MFLYPELGTYFVPFSLVWLAHETMKPYFSHRYLIAGFQYASTAQNCIGFWNWLYCTEKKTVLYCSELFRTVRQHTGKTTFYCIELHLIALNNIQMQCTTFDCIELHLIALNYIWLHWTTFDCIELHLTKMNYIWLKWTTFDCIELHLSAVN